MTPTTPLLDPTGLADLSGSRRLVVLDCRFDLAVPDWGRAAYDAGHVPNARYAHLDLDLSGPVEPGRTGRHPLPSHTAFSARAAAWGIGQDATVVAYDQGPGAFAARCWWLLRWIGHRDVRVLDGGYEAWLRAGGSVSVSQPAAVRATRALGVPDGSMVCDAGDVLHRRGINRLVDARAPERYRGDTEPLDAVAGHIPGAVSLFWQHNLGPDGRMLDPTLLRERFVRALGDADPDSVVHYCGSGVTAAHNVLAMEAAGLHGSRLYADSWSGWIVDPSRPVARGDEDGA